jgi:hypothetical protein
MPRLASLLAVLIVVGAFVPGTAFARTHCWCECEWVSPYHRRCRKVCRFIAPAVPQPHYTYTLRSQPAASPSLPIPTFDWQLPDVPTEAIVTALLVLATVSVFALIGHITSIARARRDPERITHHALTAHELRARMDAIGREADQFIDAYRRRAFERGRQG